MATPLKRTCARRLFSSAAQLVQRGLLIWVIFSLCFTNLAQAAGAGFTVVLMSRTPSGGEANFQSDYSSVAYGGNTMLDPFPIMVFSTLSTDILNVSGGPETEGLIEGDGSQNEQQYDVVAHIEDNDEPENSRTLLVSRAHSEQGSDGESVLAAIGAKDDNLVVFQSSASNLRSQSDTNQKTDIFMVDLNNLDADAVLISANAGGLQGGNNHSGNTMDNGLTAEGGEQLTDWHKPAAVYKALQDSEMTTFVVFESKATDLTLTPTNGKKQLFLRNVNDGETTLLTRNQFGEEGNGDSWQPSVSTVLLKEGCQVVFVSDATNLADVDGDGDIDAADDTNGLPDVFMLERCTEYKITLISRQWNCSGGTCTPGVQANGASSFPSFSQDGSYIVYQSSANNLIPDMDGDGNLDDQNNVTDIFLYDLTNNTQRTHIVSVASDMPGLLPGDPDIPGAQGDLPSYTPVVVYNGGGSARVVVFTSYATNLIDGDTNDTCQLVIEGHATLNCPDVFVHDFIRKQTWRVSLTQDGQEAQGNSGWPTLSGNGRFVYFTSIAQLLSEGEYTGRREIFVRDQGNPPGNPNIQPTSYTFPDVNVADVGVEMPTRMFRIVALANITVNSITVQNTTDFSVTQDLCTDGLGPRLMVAGDECVFQITFNPHQGGTFSSFVLVDLHDENIGMQDRVIKIRVKGKGFGKLFLPIAAGAGG